eukprot:m.132101 g.132101  ORF g.132101 m.132101 type:complete len:572 (-) comp14640_c0_seq5:2561-4276(-)
MSTYTSADEDTDEETSLTFKQLLHSHEKLMQEKKRMEDYFEEIDNEAENKTNKIEELKDKLGQMKRELEAAKIKASNERAENDVREQELNEELARTRRVLPSTPKLSRFDRSRGRTSVVPVATRDLSRAQLVEEIRSLESDLEYTHNKCTKQEDDISRLRNALESSESALMKLRGNEEDLYDSEKKPELPMPARRGSYVDWIEETQASSTALITVVDGQLGMLIDNVPELVDKVKQGAMVEETLTENELTIRELQIQNQELRDLLEESQHSLHATQRELKELQDMDTVPRASLSEEVVGETLENILDQQGAEESSLLMEERNSLLGETRELKKKIEDLEDSIKVNRQVQGMTIDEQIAMLSEQIHLKIQIDTLSDDLNEANGAKQRLSWEATLLKNYSHDRDQIVYNLLEKPVKAKDRKRLLNILKDTSMESAAWANCSSSDLENSFNGLGSPFTPAHDRLSASRRSSSGWSWFSRNSSPQESEIGSEVSAPRAAPPARPFPKKLLSPGIGIPEVVEESASESEVSEGTKKSDVIKNDMAEGDKIETELSAEEKELLRKMEEMNASLLSPS